MPAEINGFSVDSTGVVATVKPVLVCPAGTVTCDGTLADADELARLTGWPIAGAGFWSVTVPLTLFPPTTSDRENVTEPTQSDDDAGFTVMLAAALLAEAAVMVAVVGEDTVDVVTGNVAVVCPAATATEAGTLAAALLLPRPTVTPPEGAAAASVTVPVALCPAFTEDGEMETLAIVAVCPVWLPPVWPEAGFTVTVAEA